MNPEWPGEPITEFKLGWESYAGQSLTLWFDDVALAGQRVGCE